MRKNKESFFWHINLVHLATIYLSRSSSVGNTGIAKYVYIALVSMVNTMLTTRFNFRKDRQYIFIKFFVVMLGNWWKIGLGLFHSFMVSLFVLFISLCSSFCINTATRYIYAELDCLRRSNNQLFQNFSEIPDPIIFVDVSNYQIIYYNLNAESFFHSGIKDTQKVAAIDLINGEDDKSKFRQISTELLDNPKVSESKEYTFSVKTETNNGVRLVKYNCLLWKTSWKDSPALGLRLKPVRREFMQDGDMGN
jgi:hypothetical protein